MIIENLRLEQDATSTKVLVDVSSSTFGPDQLWFSVPRQYEKYLTIDQYDAFLVGMLYPAIMYGEDIEVRGVISEKLLFNIKTYVIALLNSYTPGTNPIAVKASQTTSAIIQNSEIGTGFSGGVDSFCTIYDRYVLEKIPDYKISKLLFLNVGSHGSYDDPNTYNKFVSRYEYLKQFPDEIGMEYIPVDSNLHKFHVWGHQKTHSLTATSGVLILQTLFRKYYLSSGLAFKEISEFINQYRDFDIGAYSDPFLLPLLSTESCELIPDGQQHLRSEKIQLIAAYEPVRRFLNVCVNSNESSYENCSVCSKCMRTISVIESLDITSEFAKVFDYEKYKKKRFRHVSKMRLDYKKSPSAKDNIDLAIAHGKYIPNMFIATAVQFPYASKGLLKKLLKLMLGNNYQQFLNKIRRQK